MTSPAVGTYFDGNSSYAHPATLQVSDGFFVVRLANGLILNYLPEAAKFLPRAGSAELTLEFQDFSRFQSVDPVFLLSPTFQQRGGIVHWLESKWQIALGSLATVLLIVFTFYQFVLPNISKKVAYSLPPGIEKSISEQTVNALEKSTLLGPTTLSVERQFKIQMLAIRIREKFPEQDWKIILKHGGSLKANAFALPDGTILVTDEITDLLTEDEMMAVLWHEVGHVKNKHGTRSLIESSALSALLLAVSGNLDWNGLPMALMASGYSREFESEADLFSARILRSEHHAPSLLSTALNKLDPGIKPRMPVLDFFSSHPSTQDRVKRIQLDGVLP